MATVLHEVKIPDIHLPESDGENLDSPWHRDAINLLVETVRCRFPDRTDYYVGGNMFVYFSLEHARNQDFRGPDFFYVKGVDRHRERRYWAVWDEDGKYPNVIVELLSASTAKEDRTTKKTVYEQTFRTPEYFLYDPDSQELEGWRLAGIRYVRIEPNEKGWLWSAQLELWLGTWDGPYQGEFATWLRCYDANGQLVLLGTEEAKQRAAAERQRADTEEQRAAAERQRADTEEQRAAAERQRADTEEQRAAAERQRADTEEQRAAAERQQAETERQRADKERQRAESERQRADAAEAELKRLRALMPDARETDS